MGLRSKRPLRYAGAQMDSGWVDTGELRTNRGGEKTATVYSGAIAAGTLGAPGGVASMGSVLVVSGPGRLNNFTANWPAGVALAGNGENACISGQPIIAYDSVTVARSGVLTDGMLAESGRKVLFAWCPPKQLASGVTNESFAARYQPQQIDAPFFNGLCVLALSGAPGYTLSYTPEVGRSGLGDDGV